MTERLKTFLRVVLALLLLGMNLPVNAVAGVQKSVGSVCCCTGMAPCLCHHAKQPCAPDCQFTKACVEDTNAVVAAMATLSPRTDHALFSLPSGDGFRGASLSNLCRSLVHASPPARSCPAQAVLRLWLI